MIEIKKHNETYIRIFCEAGITEELASYFTFEVPNYKFHPAYKARVWDGKIRLFNRRNKFLYTGLLHYVQEFAKERKYEIDIEDTLLLQTEFSEKEATDFIDTLEQPDRFIQRDYQLESFIYCIRHNRALFVSPTASGKSLIIYWIVRYYNTKTLIIIDSLNLLRQMFTDFQDYGFDSENNIHCIYSGQDKDSDKPIYITTWQSAAKQPKHWFDQFNLVIGDEAHQYDAKSLKRIMEALDVCKYRFGFTGTLRGTKTNQLTLEGLFGKYKKIVTTKELMDQGHLAELAPIKCIILKYPSEDAKRIFRCSYQDEIDFLYANSRRNNFIRNLAISLKGNTLVLFQRVESHGVPLFDLIKSSTEIPVYYVSGVVDSKEREDIRKIVNTHKDSITVASVGTFSKGVNIPNIDSIIFASPTKSQIRVLQSVGRGLRKSNTKYLCALFDIADDLSYRDWKNFTLRHYLERVKMYINEDFSYKVYPVEIK